MLHMSTQYPSHRIHQYRQSPRAQRGMVVIVLSLILLVAVSMLLVSSGKTSVMEQLISSNEFRALEASQAADAGLEYGLAWYRNNTPDWTLIASFLVPTYCDNTSFDQEAHLPSAAPDVPTASGDVYQLNVYFCRNSSDRRVLKVMSVAKSQVDSSVTKTVGVYTQPVSDLLSPYFSGAPLVVDGCVSGVGGTPQLHPSAPGAVVYETSQSIVDATMGDCVRDGATLFDGTNENLQLNGGIVKQDAFTPGDTWNYVFRQTKAEMKAISVSEELAGTALADRNVLYFENYPSATWNDSLGSETHPVVLIFTGTNNCPKINGLVKLYGVLYIDGNCDAGQGWGQANIFGSVVINGNANHLTANSEFFDWRLNSVTDVPRYPQQEAAKLMGTWADF